MDVHLTTYLLHLHLGIASCPKSVTQPHSLPRPARDEITSLCRHPRQTTWFARWEDSHPGSPILARARWPEVGNEPPHTHPTQAKSAYPRHPFPVSGRPELHTPLPPPSQPAKHARKEVGTFLSWQVRHCVRRLPHRGKLVVDSIFPSTHHSLRRIHLFIDSS